MQEFAVHVKQCQLQPFGLGYYTLGMVEEAGEVFEAVQSKDDADVLLEIGDVLWYAIAFTIEVGGDVSMLEPWPEPQPTSDTRAEVCLLHTVSKLSGRVKKFLRGDQVLEQFAPMMLQYIHDGVLQCAQVAANHGGTLEKCAAMNVAKLAGRFARGTVQGDGNSR